MYINLIWFDLIQFKYDCVTAQLRLSLFSLFSCCSRYCRWGGWAQQYVSFVELIHLNDLNDDVTFIFLTNQRPKNLRRQTTDDTWHRIKLLAGPALRAGACKYFWSIEIKATKKLAARKSVTAHMDKCCGKICWVDIYHCDSWHLLKIVGTYL